MQDAIARVVSIGDLLIGLEGGERTEKPRKPTPVKAKYIASALFEEVVPMWVGIPTICDENRCIFGHEG